MKYPLGGIIPPLTTPFDQNENFLPEKLKSNIRQLSRYDLSGFLVLGTNGESVMLDQKEKLEVIHAAREAIEPGKMMFAGTGCESVRETTVLTREAARAGADAAVVLNPFYFKAQLDHEALKKHFWTVADAATIPVIIYNMPQNTGLDMTAETILEIAGHPNIIGLKDSGGDLGKMDAIIRQAKPGFRTLVGSAGFLLPALKLGAAGGVLALANIAPVICLKILKLFSDGNIDEAEILQKQILALNTAVTRGWGVPALKEAMDMLGLYGGPARLPLMKATPQIKENLLQLLKENNVQPV
ncbi:MAG TPA: dihydrodipicolinate synthase family protein [Bacteroidales bacterium]|nr:dihydrodipicolinate synthase family protein [Bacteroidales bacterium]